MHNQLAILLLTKYYAPAPGVVVDVLGVDVLSDGFVDVPVLAPALVPLEESSAVVAASITIVGLISSALYTLTVFSGNLSSLEAASSRVKIGSFVSLSFQTILSF